jgi:hypothetical protein
MTNKIAYLSHDQSPPSHRSQLDDATEVAQTRDLNYKIRHPTNDIGASPTIAKATHNGNKKVEERRENTLVRTLRLWI